MNDLQLHKKYNSLNDPAENVAIYVKELKKDINNIENECNILSIYDPELAAKKEYHIKELEKIINDLETLLSDFYYLF